MMMMKELYIIDMMMTRNELNYVHGYDYVFKYNHDQDAYDYFYELDGDHDVDHDYEHDYDLWPIFLSSNLLIWQCHGADPSSCSWL